MVFSHYAFFHLFPIHYVFAFVSSSTFTLFVNFSPIIQNSKSLYISLILIQHSFFPFCSVIALTVYFSLIRASPSPPLCSALVSRGLRADLVREMAWEWQSAKGTRASESEEQTALTYSLVKLLTLIQYIIWSSVIHYPAQWETRIKSWF